MSISEFMGWTSGERGRPHRPIRPPKKADSKPEKAHWRRTIDDLNEALEILEAHGADLKGYRVRLPPKAVCDLNSRIEAQLLRLGVPAYIHSVLGSTIGSHVFKEEIEERTMQVAIDSGLVGDSRDIENLSEADQARLLEVQGMISLQLFCDAIGVELDGAEAREVVRGAMEWEKGA